MLNLIKWSNGNYQIIIEGTSFYFSKKLPIAYRMPGDKRLIVRGGRFGKLTQNFIFELSLLKHRMVTRPVEEFKELLESAYKKSIYTGAKNFAMQRLHHETSHEGDDHVISGKNDGRQS